MLDLRKHLVTIAVLTLGTCASAPGPREASTFVLPGLTGLEAAAVGFIATLEKGDFDAARATFTPEMKQALPPKRLDALWRSVDSQHGDLRRPVKVKTEPIQGYTRVFVKCEFEKGMLYTIVVYDAQEKLAGLFFDSVGAVEAEYEPPSYADTAVFRELDVTVGAGGDWALPGTLSLPRGAGPFPAVVLVHGSGPNDRDEALGPQKPFRDLAWGLATRGIAVLRYDKRTFVHTERLIALKATMPITVKEETVDDALAAVALLRGRKEVDPRRIFVLGHSLGGTLAPKIGKRDPRLAGLIVMAGACRPLEDLLIDQSRYLAGLDGEISREEKEKLAEIEKQVAGIKSADLSPDTPASALPFNSSPSYWLDLREYNPAELARTLELPMLILQGERDYQVTMADFAIWKSALNNRKDVTFKSYPTLHHLFMKGTGEGKSGPGEYEMQDNVAEAVIDDIASWIVSLGAGR